MNTDNVITSADARLVIGFDRVIKNMLAKCKSTDVSNRMDALESFLSQDFEALTELFGKMKTLVEKALPFLEDENLIFAAHFLISESFPETQEGLVYMKENQFKFLRRLAGLTLKHEVLKNLDSLSEWGVDSNDEQNLGNLREGLTIIAENLRSYKVCFYSCLDVLSD